MRTRFILALCCVALASCSRATAPLPYGGVNLSADVVRVQSQGAYQTLDSFGGGASGANPEAGLVAYRGKLYGTTNGAGSGYGAVFAMPPPGGVSIIHRFVKGDGAYPTGRLVVLHDVLYGTTTEGGAHGQGTVFGITTSGEESVIHSFGRPGDGEYPDAGLVVMNGVLYGTTRNGGAHGRGTVFAITPERSEHVLHSFGGTPDGGHPSAGLIVYKGELYGTTRAGGKNDAGGAAFKIDAFGDERVIHSFGVNPADGANPAGDLVAVNGLFYGTTIHGGAVGPGFGTVFEMNAGGKEFVLHSFGLGRDGAYPLAGLASLGGELYGTTEGGGDTPENKAYCVFFGGAQDGSGANRCGTIFEITRYGRERVLYRFHGYPDGANPISALAAVTGSLYGTAFWGGSKEYYGTTFRLSP